MGSSTETRLPEQAGPDMVATHAEHHMAADLQQMKDLGSAAHAPAQLRWAWRPASWQLPGAWAQE